VVGPAKPVEKKKSSFVRKRSVEFSNQDWELVDDYPRVVKRAREGMRLKQEELAKKISEPESLIHRIETGHKRPKPDVARKLEKTLNVKLISNEGDEEIEFEQSRKKEVTLGDLIVVRNKKE